MDPQYCEVCKSHGVASQLQRFQINLKEVIYLCPNKQCTYPIGRDSCTTLVKDCRLEVPADAPPPTSHLPSLSSIVGSFDDHGGFDSGFLDFFDLDALVTDEAAVADVASRLASSVMSDDPEDGQDVKSGALECQVRSSPKLPENNTWGTKENSANKSGAAQVREETTSNTCVQEAQLLNREIKQQDTDVVPTENGNIVKSPTSLLPDLLDSSQLDIQRDNVDPGTTCKTVTAAKEELFLQWKNKESLCWLDVAMSLLVHCKYIQRTVENLAECLISQLIRTYWEAVSLINLPTGKPMSLETSVGTVTVRTGGGSSATCLDVIHTKSHLHPSSLEASTKKNCQQVKGEKGCLPAGKLQEACQMLETIREVIWSSLQPRLNCSRGKDDSPVFALPLLLAVNPSVEDTCCVEYTWKMLCCHCGYQHDDRVHRTLPTFPNVPADFSMMAPCFVRTCFKCGAKKQRMNMIFNRLPPVVMIHFVEGLPDVTLSNYDFTYHGAIYKVTGVVQYRTKPNHFVAWIRNKDDRWMECNDLRDPLCRFSDKTPDFPGSQVHVVMWERQGEPQPSQTSDGRAKVPQVSQEMSLWAKNSVKPWERKQYLPASSSKGGEWPEDNGHSLMSQPTLVQVSCTKEQNYNSQAATVLIMAKNNSSDPLNTTNCHPPPVSRHASLVQSVSAVSKIENLQSHGPLQLLARRIPASQKNEQAEVNKERIDRMRENIRRLKMQNVNKSETVSKHSRSHLKLVNTPITAPSEISPRTVEYINLLKQNLYKQATTKPHRMKRSAMQQSENAVSQAEPNRRQETGKMSYLAAVQPFLKLAPSLSSRRGTGCKFECYQPRNLSQLSEPKDQPQDTSALVNRKRKCESLYSPKKSVKFSPKVEGESTKGAEEAICDTAGKQAGKVEAKTSAQSKAELKTNTADSLAEFEDMLSMPTLDLWK